MASIDEAIERGVEKAFEKPVEILGGRSLKQLIAEFREGEIVPVVRCKDCKHSEQVKMFDISMILCENLCYACGENRRVEPDWFCADGERREP